jgi:hypothetical protein
MKGFLIVIIAFCFWGCMKQTDSGNPDIGYYEHYRLINPNNLFYSCKGDLLLNYTNNDYSFIYDFTCIFREDTVKFYLSETGKFSDTFEIVPFSSSSAYQGYYFSGKLSFVPIQNQPWGCTYQLSDTTGFNFTFIDPVPHLITYIPVSKQKMMIHVMDSVSSETIKPWVQVVPVESGKIDTMQLFWR